MSFLGEAIGDFEGTLSPNHVDMGDAIMAKMHEFYNSTFDPSVKSSENVSSRDHDLYVLYERVMMDGSTESMQAL